MPLTLITASSFLCLLATAAGQADRSAERRALAREVLTELVSIDTTQERGATRAAEVIARRLRQAGFAEADLTMAGPLPHKQNLVVRLPGSGAARPILFILHLDVVAVDPKEWTAPPFAVTERDGYLYGRGTADMKGKVAAVVAALIQLRQERYVPDRDLVVAFTDDEEQGPVDTNGIRWLLKEQPGLLRSPALAINPDLGGGAARHGRRFALLVQTAEKIDVSLVLEAADRGGHSSKPHAGNPIYRVARAAGRIEAHSFPVRLDELTRRYLSTMAAGESGALAEDLRKLAADPVPDPARIARISSASDDYAARLRTTCVTTLISGGHADNALPQGARATVNCRILPGETVEETEATLRRVAGDDGLRWSRLFEPVPAPASPLTSDVLAPVAQIAAELFPGVAIAPMLSLGASDGLYLRAAGIPTYGVGGLFGDIDDVRSHGRDERIGVVDFENDVGFTYSLVKALTQTRSEATAH